MNLKFCLLIAGLLASYCSFSQAKPENVRLFIDCRTSCDQSFIKTEIDYINYVNDQFESNVYLLITSQGTGSGGREYKLQFTGQGPFAGISDTLSYIREANATDDEDRRTAVRTIGAGILPFLIKTEKSADIIISFRDQENSAERQVTPENDPWNFWVLSFSANGSFSSEKNYSSKDLRGGFYASHVTDKMKVDFSLDASTETNRYGEGSDEFRFTNKSYDFDNTTVWSIGPKWSVGGSVSIEQSDYSNYRLGASFKPGIEYSFYPYVQAPNQSVTLMYRVGPEHYKYIEETIYDKMEETRMAQSLALELRYNKQWGEISGSTSFNHYFHDFDKSRLSFWGNVEVRVFKGLFVNFGGSYAFQRDQLNIEKGDITDEDLLTRRRELNSEYDFDLDFGFRYRFGSVLNNIVNPRF